MPDFDVNDHFELQNEDSGPFDEEVCTDDDLLMEQILVNINNTPIGQVLKKIASLPEVRKEKVIGVRQQLTEGEYNLSERLDVALEKVLEELET